MKILLLCIVLTLSMDADGHSSFSEHFANGISTMKQVFAHKGKVIEFFKLFSEIEFSDLKSALQSCLQTAEAFNDESLMSLCYTTIFNNDYFWL